MDVLFTMEAYYDGPRSGVCSLNGEPMFYESTWEDMADDPDGNPLPHRYLLAPIASEALEKALEGGRIWERWNGRLHEGPAVDEANPGLAADRQRWVDLGAVLQRGRESAEWSQYVELEESGGQHDRPENGLFWVKWRELPFPSPTRLAELWRDSRLRGS